MVFYEVFGNHLNQSSLKKKLHIVVNIFDVTKDLTQHYKALII